MIAKGYLTIKDLIGTTDIKPFLRACRLAEFDDWFKDKARAIAEKQNKKDEVEYFE